MPIYEYAVRKAGRGCDYCSAGFDVLQKMSEAPLNECPQCGAAVQRLISAPAIGGSRSGYDQRAKAAGFHKLKKLSHGEYEKQY